MCWNESNCHGPRKEDSEIPNSAWISAVLGGWLRGHMIRERLWWCRDSWSWLSAGPYQKNVTSPKDQGMVEPHDDPCHGWDHSGQGPCAKVTPVKLWKVIVSVSQWWGVVGRSGLGEGFSRTHLILKRISVQHIWTSFSKAGPALFCSGPQIRAPFYTDGRFLRSGEGEGFYTS